MKRTVKIKLKENNDLIETIQEYSKVKQYLCDFGLIKKYKDLSPIAGTLLFKNKNLYLNLVLEKESPNININNFKITDFIGMDRGIKNIVVGSNKQFFKSLHLKEIKGKYQYKKKVLQSKGTKSALRKLKRIAGKERRFVSD